jgi:ribosomal protein S25
MKLIVSILFIQPHQIALREDMSLPVAQRLLRHL